jgi:hypothetical protein
VTSFINDEVFFDTTVLVYLFDADCLARFLARHRNRRAGQFHLYAPFGHHKP